MQNRGSQVLSFLPHLEILLTWCLKTENPSRSKKQALKKVPPSTALRANETSDEQKTHDSPVRSMLKEALVF